MAVFIFSWLLFAVGVGVLADSRGRSGVGHFFLSVLLSPLIGLIIVLVAEDLVKAKQAEEDRRYQHQRELESIKTIVRATETPPKAAPAAPQPVSVSVADELNKLLALKDRGALTDDEFAAQKRRLLSAPGG
jgi:hypothetical protein